MHQTPRRTAAPLAGAVLVLGLLAGCGDDSADRDSSSGGEPTSDSAPQPTASATDETSAGPSSSAPAQEGVVPAYYVGTTPVGDRLYREFTRTTGVDLLVAAAAAVTQGDPVDPDYRTLWPGGRFVSVTRTAGSIVVEVPDESWLRAGDLSRAEARLAVQQLVHTLQGTAGKRLPLQVQHDGSPAATLLGVEVGAGLTAEPQLDVLAFVNVTEPAEGTAVGTSFTAEGRASSFEGTVVWELRDEDGTVVLNGFAQADGWVDKLYPWETEVSTTGLSPGTYMFVARTDDPSDGEGAGPTEDTKRVTVG